MLEFLMNYAIKIVEKELAEHEDAIQEAFIEQMRKLSDMLIAYLDDKVGLKDETRQAD